MNSNTLAVLDLIGVLATMAQNAQEEERDISDEELADIANVLDEKLKRIETKINELED